MADYGTTQNKGNDVLIDDSSIKHNNNTAKNMITRLNNRPSIMVAKSNDAASEPIKYGREKEWGHFPMRDTIYNSPSGYFTTTSDGDVIIGKGIKTVRVECQISWELDNPNALGYVFYKIRRNNDDITKCIDYYAQFGTSTLSATMEVQEGDIISSYVYKSSANVLNFYNWNQAEFGPGRTCYMTVEAIAFNDEGL